MADKSKIEWTDATWNPITGCSPVSEGCRNCYAERMVKRLPKLHGHVIKFNPNRDEIIPFSQLAFHPERIEQPIRWKKPRRIFVGSMTDLFHENVPFDWVGTVFGIMAAAPQHTFMLLTKRPARMLGFFRWVTENIHFRPGNEDYNRPLSRCWRMAINTGGLERLDVRDFDTWPLPNVWLGVTAENQQAADERIPILLQTPAAKRFVSVEPMLGPVDLTELPIPPEVDDRGFSYNAHAKLDWVICGGESGPGARPMDPEWARSLLSQCRSAGVAFFMKQMTKKAPIPDDLMVKEFPDAR